MRLEDCFPNIEVGDGLKRLFAGELPQWVLQNPPFGGSKLRIGSVGSGTRDRGCGLRFRLGGKRDDGSAVGCHPPGYASNRLSLRTVAPRP